MITRAEWGAQKGPGPHISVPTSQLYVHHTVTFVTGGRNATLADEKAHVRAGERDWGFSIGIPYSFLIFPSGRVFEGQGWGRKGAHTCNNDRSRCWNTTAHGVAFIGNYEFNPLFPEQIDAFRRLVAEGKDRGKLAKGVEILPHKSVKSTACPGQNVMNNLSELKKEEDEMTEAERKRLNRVEAFMEAVLQTTIADEGHIEGGKKVGRAVNLTHELRRIVDAEAPFGGMGRRVGDAVLKVEDMEQSPTEEHKHDEDYAPVVHDHAVEASGTAR